MTDQERHKVWVGRAKGGLLIAVLFGLLLGSTGLLWPVGRTANIISITEQVHAAGRPMRGVSVVLPQTWSGDSAESRKRRLFSGAFEAAGGQPMGLLISRVAGELFVRVNGVLVAQGAYESTALAGIGYRPVYVNLPYEILRERNLIEISLSPDQSGRSGLAPIRVDEAAEITRSFYVFWFLNTGLLIVAATAAALALCLSLVIWRGTKEPAYRDFSVASGFLTTFFLTQLGISDGSVDWAHAGFLTLVVVFFIGFVARSAFEIVELLDRPIRLACGASLVFLAAVAILGVMAQSRALIAIVETSAYLLAFGSALAVLPRSRKSNKPTAAFFLLALFVALGVSLMDVTYRLGPTEGFAAPPLSELAAIIMLATIFVFTIEQYIAASRAIRDWNRQLEVRVQQTDAELREVYRRLLEREKHVAITSERHRILKEMHDGLGGQLVATMSLADNAQSERIEIKQSLDACMTELRLAVDSLDPAHSDLLNALATLRQRLTPVLNRSGISFGWSVRELEQRKPMTPDEVLQTFRILQEAVTNVIKHSGASRAALSCGHCDKRGIVWLTLRDNGQPVSPRVGKGYGIENMRSRARAIGASLSIRWSSPLRRGTTIRLIWPVAEPLGEPG